MRNSYLANSAEALNLHNGSQTAIVVAMKVQPNEDGVTYMPNPPVLDWEQIYKTKWKPYLLTTEEGEDLAINPPYKLGHEVYVREKMYELGRYYTTSYNESGEYETRWHSKGGFIPACNGKTIYQSRIVSAATMPKLAARTRFIPVRS